MFDDVTEIDVYEKEVECISLVLNIQDGGDAMLPVWREVVGLSTTKMNTMDSVACRLVLLSLMYANRWKCWLSVSYNNSHRLESNLFDITNRQLIRVYNWLEHEGLVEVQKGYISQSGKKIGSKIRATEKLKSFFKHVKQQDVVNSYLSGAEKVLLRDKDGNNMVIGQTKLLTSYSNLVYYLNSTNSSYEWMFCGEELNASTYRRIFNVTLKRGGRYYDSFVQCISNKENGVMKEDLNKTRLGITIGGESVVEVDFVAIHPVIMGIVEGLHPLHYTGLNGFPDIYERIAEKARLDKLSKEDGRAFAKVVLNCMLNCETEAKAKRAIQSHINSTPTLKGQNAKHWYNCAMFCCDLISHQFHQPDYTGAGLQYIDSMIASRIMQDFVEVGKPLGCVHDSFIVRQSDEGFLKHSMYNAMVDVMKVKDPVAVSIKDANGRKDIVAIFNE